jgi:hypothetical protein
MNTHTTPSNGHAPSTARTRPSRIARGRRAVALCTLTAGLAAALAPAAQAATSVVANQIDGTLAVTAAPGKANAITVDRPGPFVVGDTGDTVTAGTGCTQLDPQKVSCVVGHIDTVSVLSNDLDDRIVYKPEGAAGSLRGGAGNDLIRLGGAAPSSDLNVARVATRCGAPLATTASTVAREPTSSPAAPVSTPSATADGQSP